VLNSASRPAVFAAGRNCPGASRPRVGFPADQGFEGDGLTLGVDKWLVPGPKLPTSEGFAEFNLQVELIDAGLPDRVIGHGHPVAATAFGHVHRHIGVAKERGAGGMFGLRTRERGEADTHADDHLIDANPERPTNRHNQVVGKIDRRFSHVPDEGDHELVAAEPIDLDRSGGARRKVDHSVTQSSGHIAKQPVADLMAAGIVDHFEAIKIAQQHRHRTVGADPGRKLGIHRLVERESVGESGQRVGTSQKFLDGQGLLHRKPGAPLPANGHADRRQHGRQATDEQNNDRGNSGASAVVVVGAHDYRHIHAEQGKRR
jgi:hypothetical protein